MRKPLAAALVLAVCCTLAASLLPACRPKPQALPMQPVPWADGETATYTWLQAGARVGSGTFSQRLTEGGWVIHNDAEIGGYRHAGDVLVGRETLIPRSSTITNEGSPAGYAIDATYDADAGKAALVAHTPQGDRDLTVRLPAGHYVDNEQLLTTLRALPLAEGFKLAVNLVNTAGGQKLQVDVEVKAVETVSLTADGLAGTEHRVFRVALLGGAQTAYYTVDAPHILLKYNNGQLEAVLTGFTAGGL